MSDDLVKRARDCANGLVDTKTDRGDLGIFDDLADRIEELEAKLAKAVARLDKLAYWLDIDQELWDAFTVMEKSDHRHMQSEVQAVKDILTGGKDE